MVPFGGGLLAMRADCILSGGVVAHVAEVKQMWAVIAHLAVAEFNQL
jgi:hypothetical protein